MVHGLTVHGELLKCVQRLVNFFKGSLFILPSGGATAGRRPTAATNPSYILYTSVCVIYNVYYIKMRRVYIKIRALFSFYFLLLFPIRAENTDPIGLAMRRNHSYSRKRKNNAKQNVSGVECSAWRKIIEVENVYIDAFSFLFSLPRSRVVQLLYLYNNMCTHPCFYVVLLIRKWNP